MRGVLLTKGEVLLAAPFIYENGYTYILFLYIYTHTIYTYTLLLFVHIHSYFFYIYIRIFFYIYIYWTKDFTVDEERFIMSHASMWWKWHEWSDDAILRYTSYLRNDSMTNRTRDSILHLMINFESSLIFMQWSRIEIIIFIIISIIIAIIISNLSVINRHEDKMTESTTSKQCDEDEIKSRCPKMSFDWWRSHWVDESIISNKWIDHFECMRRLSRLNESKNDYIERSKFSQLIERQKKKFNLYQSN
jgi:hypothetical protein